MKLGSWLIARGKITGVQLKRALLDQSFYGGHLSSSLMKLGYLDEKTLGEYLSEAFQVPCAKETHFGDIPPEVVRMIPEQLAQKHQMVPLSVEGKKLRLAMMNPGDILVMDEVAFLTGMSIEPWVSSESHLLSALERYYNLPKAAGETIPLLDRLEGREDPVTARRRFLEASDAAESQAPPPPTSPGAEELGLDGRPLSLPAEVVTEFYPRSAVVPQDVPSKPLPKSLEEWREELQASQAASPTQERIPALPPPALASRAAASLPPQQAAPPPPPSAPLVSSSPPPASARRPALSLVPGPSLASLEHVSDRLKRADSRDEVFDAILDFYAGRFSRSALFLVTQEKVVGFGARGDGFDPARIRATSVELRTPSIFSYFRTGSEFYYGPVPGLPANQQFYRQLEVAPPERVLVVPLHIKERLIALIYGDQTGSRREDPDVSLYRRLAQKAMLALEVLILRNKIGMV
jgi:Type II secretion system (T2SS), protein E, N-terminal domain